MVKKIPPDGGWGYMICVGFTVINLIVIAPKFTVGLLFKDLINNSENGATAFTIYIAVAGILIAFSGLIVNYCLMWMSLRQVCYMGIIFYSLCWIGDIFLTNAFQLIMTEGILRGLGTGILNIVCYVVFNQYFLEKRMVLMSICMTIVGLGAIVAPFLVDYWMNIYGYRGTVIMLTAVSLNNFIGGALFQPVEWHQVDKEDDDDFHLPTKTYVKVDDDVIVEGAENQQEEKNDINKMQSLVCINNSALYIDDMGKEENEKKTDEIFNFELLKNITFHNIAFGNGIGVASDINFFMILPLLLYEYGMSNSDVAICVSIVSIADLVSRIVLSIVGKYVKIVSYHWYYVSLIITLIGRTVFLQFSSFFAVSVVLSLLGFMRAWIHVLYPLLVAEELPEENYAKTFGMSFLAHGLVGIIYAVLLSLARDCTGSHVVSFYILAFSVIIPVATYTFEFCVVRPRKRREKIT